MCLLGKKYITKRSKACYLSIEINEYDGMLCLFFIYYLIFYQTAQIEFQCGIKNCIISFHDSVHCSVKFEIFQVNYELPVSFNANGNFCKA